MIYFANISEYICTHFAGCFAEYTAASFTVVKGYCLVSLSSDLQLHKQMAPKTKTTESNVENNFFTINAPI